MTHEADSAPALRADRLGRRYGQAWGLRDCTFEVPQGSIVGLVGPNGAGKTTLLNVTVGLLAPLLGQELERGTWQLAWTQTVPPVTGHLGDLVNSVTRVGDHLVVSYLPASAFWPLQFIAGGILLAVALGASGTALWLLRRRTR